MAIRVGLGQQVALRIVSIAGTAAHRVDNGGLVVHRVVLVGGSIAHPVGGGSLETVAVVGMRAGISHRVGFGDELARIRVSIGIHMAQRAGLLGQAAGCVVLIGGFVAKRISGGGNVTLVVGGIGRGVAQGIRAGGDEALAVIGIGRHTAAGVGGFGHLALVVVLVGQACAILLGDAGDLVIVIIGIGFCGPVGICNAGNIAGIADIGVACGVPVAIGLAGFAEEIVVGVADRAGVVRLRGDQIVIVIDQRCDLPALVRGCVGLGLCIISKGRCAALRGILRYDLVILVIGVLDHNRSIEVRYGEQTVVIIVGIQQGVAVGVRHFGQVIACVFIGHRSAGTVRQGCDVISIVGERKAAGVGRHFRQVISVIAQFGDGSVRLDHSGAVAFRIKVNVFTLVIRQDDPRFRITGQAVEVALLCRPAVAIGFHVKRHETAAGHNNRDIAVADICKVGIVVAPAIAEISIIQ